MNFKFLSFQSHALVRKKELQVEFRRISHKKTNLKYVDTIRSSDPSACKKQRQMLQS